MQSVSISIQLVGATDTDIFWPICVGRAYRSHERECSRAWYGSMCSIAISGNRIKVMCVLCFAVHSRRSSFAAPLRTTHVC